MTCRVRHFEPIRAALTAASYYYAVEAGTD